LPLSKTLFKEHWIKPRTCCNDNVSGVFLLGCQNNGQMLPLFIKKAPVRGFFYVPTGFSATCTLEKSQFDKQKRFFT
ncbi:hypothetical protein ABEQ76_24685, partial [Bacillus velezensis]